MGVVVSPMYKRLAGAQQGRGVDWDHYRPLETLSAMDSNNFDGVSVRIDAAFVAGHATYGQVVRCRYVVKCWYYWHVPPVPL